MQINTDIHTRPKFTGVHEFSSLSFWKALKIALISQDKYLAYLKPLSEVLEWSSWHACGHLAYHLFFNPNNNLLILLKSQLKVKPQVQERSIGIC